MYTQTTVSMQFQCGVAGGRSHVGNLEDVIRGMSSCDVAGKETWSQGDTTGPEGQGRAGGSWDRG